MKKKYLKLLDTPQIRQKSDIAFLKFRQIFAVFILTMYEALVENNNKKMRLLDVFRIPSELAYIF